MSDESKELKTLISECRKKLYFKARKIPKLTVDEIYYNFEMIASEEEDYITLFKEGFLTRLGLIHFLSGNKNS